MKIIEKIINAFLISRNYSVKVSNVISLAGSDGKFTGISCDADVSFDFLYSYAPAYSSIFLDIPFPGFEDQDIADGVKRQLDVVKNKRNRSFLIDHIRFPVSSKEGFTLKRGDSYDVTDCEYNKQRLLHLTRQGRFSDDYLTFKDGLSSFFSYVNVELHEIMKEGICLALDVLNKIITDQPDRLIKDFKYHDCFGSYNVQIFCKGMPVDILETMIAPDRLSSNLSGSRQIMKNARRYLKGFALSNRVYMKYGWRLADVDTSDYAKVMSDRELHARDDLKAFCGVFVKECFASGKNEYEAYLNERQHAIRYGY
ncbi:hypothetical protein KGN64_003178 [Salmonella enterica]|nr:hypothetical protein [Salmonella enterica]EHM5263997.1 hypothetical protein [Salmonella enterica]